MRDGLDARRRIGEGDDGNVLPMVLAFVTVIGVVVGALLGQASANFSATTALRDNRDRVYAADAGLEWVLARAGVITATLANATDPVACPQTLAVNGATVSISCSGQRDQFTVTSTAVKDGSTSVATAVLVRLPSQHYIPREWVTATG